MMKNKGDVSIGNAGQVNIDSPGARQNVSGDQIIAPGLELATIRAALQEQRELIAKAALPAEDAERIEDAIVNAEREMDQPQPNASRLRRFVGQVVTIARDLGLNMAGGLIAAGLVG